MIQDICPGPKTYIGMHLFTRAESAEASPSIIGCSLVIITQGAIGCIDNDLLDTASQGWKLHKIVS